MNKKIKQLCISQTSDLNSFTTSNGEDWSDNLIENMAVTQLGISALPGTEFKFYPYSNEKLIINNSGLFSVDLKDGFIEYLSVSKTSLEKIKEFNYMIIIDLIYYNMEDLNNG